MTNTPHRAANPNMQESIAIHWLLCKHWLWYFLPALIYSSVVMTPLFALAVSGFVPYSLIPIIRNQGLMRVFKNFPISTERLSVIICVNLVILPVLMAIPAAIISHNCGLAWFLPEYSLKSIVLAGLLTIAFTCANIYFAQQNLVDGDSINKWRTLPMSLLGMGLLWMMIIPIWLTMGANLTSIIVVVLVIVAVIGPLALLGVKKSVLPFLYLNNDPADIERCQGQYEYVAYPISYGSATWGFSRWILKTIPGRLLLWLFIGVCLLPFFLPLDYSEYLEGLLVLSLIFLLLELPILIQTDPLCRTNKLLPFGSLQLQCKTIIVSTACCLAMLLPLALHQLFTESASALAMILPIMSLVLAAELLLQIFVPPVKWRPRFDINPGGVILLGYLMVRMVLPPLYEHFPSGLVMSFVKALFPIFFPTDRAEVLRALPLYLLIFFCVPLLTFAALYIQRAIRRNRLKTRTQRLRDTQQRTGESI